MDQKLAMLKRVPLFAGLDGRGLEAVGRLADEVDVQEGHVLTREGGRGGEFFVIVEGGVAVERGGRHIRDLGPGDFLGEIALVDGGPRTATVTTTMPSRVLVIGHREFHTLLEDFKDIRVEVLEALARRVRALEPDLPH